MIKFPSINQFRSVIKNIRSRVSFAGFDVNGEPIYEARQFPTVRFLGTVKLHGTNSSIVQEFVGSDFVAQSRNNVLTLEHDNAGFAAYVSVLPKDKLTELFAQIRATFEIADSTTVTIFGEWCGGNIQKGVAISGLTKMFVLFGIKIGAQEDDGYHVTAANPFFRQFSIPEHKIFNISDFKTFTVDIDFNHPELAQNKIVEYTIEVENECPVGVHFISDNVDKCVLSLVNNKIVSSKNIHPLVLAHVEKVLRQLELDGEIPEIILQLEK